MCLNGLENKGEECMCCRDKSVRMGVFTRMMEM